MSRKPTSETTTPAAQLETARAEHEAAEKELAALDVHAGTLDAAATRRRDLLARVEIAKERLTLAQSRFDEYEYGRIENEIAELQGDAAQIESELALAREKAEADLRQHLNGDWLSGTGRFASCPPAIHGLLGYSNSVSEVAQRLDSVRARINHLERKIADRRQERARQAAAERVDRRRRLIGGDAVAVDLTPWRFVAVAGFGADVADSLERKFVPMAVVDPRGREIHCLLPSDSGPHGWADNNHLESVEQMPPAELCPALVSVWQRANPPKKSGASRR
jgi:hypothetical protein